MSEFSSNKGNISEEVTQRAVEEELFAIDWTAQAEGFALMYERTGDTDYELYRIECEEKARQQQRIFSEIQQLESLLH